MPAPPSPLVAANIQHSLAGGPAAAAPARPSIDLDSLINNPDVRSNPHVLDALLKVLTGFTDIGYTVYVDYWPSLTD
jgi:hypothetical protein